MLHVASAEFHIILVVALLASDIEHSQERSDPKKFYHHAKDLSKYSQHASAKRLSNL